MTNRPREWDIWKPNDNHPHWKPDEQTYAIETGKGHYNPEIYSKIDHTISYSAYAEAMEQIENLQKALVMIAHNEAPVENTWQLSKNIALNALLNLKEWRGK